MVVWPRANDHVTLLSVGASLNHGKGAKEPHEWLPPEGQCGYVARCLRVVKLYSLMPKARESAWFQAFPEECRRKWHRGQTQRAGISVQRKKNVIRIALSNCNQASTLIELLVAVLPVIG